MRKKRLSTGETIAFVVILFLLFLTFFPCPPWSRKTHIARRYACVNNLRQLHLALIFYTTENKDWLPPIDKTKNNFMFDANLLYPEYLEHPGVLACPADPSCDYESNFHLLSADNHPASSPGDVHPDCMTDMSYCYLGWEVTSDREAEVFFKAYDNPSSVDRGREIPNPDPDSFPIGALYNNPTSHFWPPEGMSDEKVEVLRQEWIRARAHIKNADEVPIMWDMPYTDPGKLSHQPPGGNVLYLDGHVEFIKFGEKFPMTETMARLLEERPRAPIPD